MPKDEWGIKRVCPTCATRFYDMQHDPMTCPSCGAAFTIESLTAVKPKALRPEKVKPVPEDSDDLPEIETEDDSLTSDDDLDDEILEDDDDNVDLEEIADVASEDDDS
jgi:uncharacterized protein (TIGR02300 family)